MDYIDLLSVITEIATPILVVLVLAAVIGTMLWAGLKAAPVLQRVLEELKEFIDAQTESMSHHQKGWEKLIDRQALINEQLSKALEERIKLMEAQLAARDAEIARLTDELNTVRKELDEVKAERDKLSKRVKSIEAAQKDQK